MSSTHHHTHSQVPPNSQINTTNPFLWCIWRFLGHQFPRHTPPILQQSHAEFCTKYRCIAMGITSPGLITPPIFKLATITLPFSVYEEILVIYFLLTPLCLPPQQLQLATPSDGQTATLRGENCSTKAIAPPIFKLATKVIPSTIKEEVLTINYVIPPFCWPPLTIPLLRVI